MKKLVYAAVVASAFVAGCVVEDDPVIFASITLTSAGGGPITFQEGDGLRINARLSGTASGYSDIYPPDTVALQTPPLTAGFGLYDFWVDYINDARGETVIVSSTDTAFSVDVQDDVNLVVDLALDNGFFFGNWTFNGGANTCADYAGTEDGVSILSTGSTPSDAFDDVFNCADGAGMAPAFTSPLPLDTYTISVALIDANGAALGTAPEITNQRIVDGNDYNDLGVIDIAVP